MIHCSRVPFVLLLGLVLAGGCARPAPRAEPIRAPGPTPDEAVRIVVLSDLNSSYGSTTYEPEVAAAVAHTVAWRPSLVLIAGDMVAGQRPALSDAEVRAMWAAFDRVVASPLRDADIPLAFTIGNHDGSAYPAHARDRRLAAEYWRDPRHRPALDYRDDDAYPFRYAFEHDGIFVVAVDASTGEVVRDDGQMRWLQRTLASPAARAAGVRVVLGHVPLYAVAEGRNRTGEVQAEPEQLRELLEAGDVGLFISGHHHAWYPARRGNLALLHTGALGQTPRPLIGSETEPYKALTVVDVFPARDSVVEHTFRIEGSRLERLDVRSLPAELRGINGVVQRRDDGLLRPR